MHTPSNISGALAHALAPCSSCRAQHLTRAVQVVQLLLEAGASPFVLDDEGQSALHHAALEGKLDAVQQLAPSVECPQILLEDAYQMTPFHLACEGGHKPVVEHLLRMIEQIEGPQMERASQLRRGSAVFLAQQAGHDGVVTLIQMSAQQDQQRQQRQEQHQGQPGQPGQQGQAAQG